MITWLGFIGKLVDFILEKIISKKIEMRMDTKRKAARTFVHLYDAVELLEAAASKFIVVTQPLIDGKQPRIYAAWMKQVSPKVDQASAQFLTAVGELQQILRFYDPVLSVFLADVWRSKVEFASAIEKMRFQVEWDDRHHLKGLRYTIPSETLMRTDFQRDALDQRSDWSLDEFQWSKGTLGFLLQGETSEGTIAVDDIPRIKWLHQKVSEQLPLLSAVRKHLSEFIKHNFSIDDLLYAVD